MTDTINFSADAMSVTARVSAQQSARNCQGNNSLHIPPEPILPPVSNCGFAHLYHLSEWISESARNGYPSLI